MTYTSGTYSDASRQSPPHVACCASADCLAPMSIMALWHVPKLQAKRPPSGKVLVHDQAPLISANRQQKKPCCTTKRPPGRMDHDMGLKFSYFRCAGSSPFPQLGLCFPSWQPNFWAPLASPPRAAPSDILAFAGSSLPSSNVHSEDSAKADGQLALALAGCSGSGAQGESSLRQQGLR